MDKTTEALKLALGQLQAGFPGNAMQILREALAQTQEPEYAWPTVADYERDVGFQTNEAFRMAWGMARTTNKMLGHPSPPQRTWVGLTDTQIEQVYFDVVKEHRGAPMPWGQVQFGRALLDKFKEVNT